MWSNLSVVSSHQQDHAPDPILMADHTSDPNNWAWGFVAFAPRLQLEKRMDLPTGGKEEGGGKKSRRFVNNVKQIFIKQWMKIPLSSALACSIIEAGWVNQGHGSFHYVAHTVKHMNNWQQKWAFIPLLLCKTASLVSLWFHIYKDIVKPRKWNTTCRESSSCFIAPSQAPSVCWTTAAMLNTSNRPKKSSQWAFSGL